MSTDMLLLRNGSRAGAEPRHERVAGTGNRIAATAKSALTVAALLIFGVLGGIAKSHFGLMLPGPVIGLILIATTLVIIELRSQRLAAGLHAASAPTARGLLAHMGLLFVPAGAGIITEFPTLRHAGLALGAGVIASALVGVAVTYATMRLLARRVPVTADARADAAC